MNGYLCRRKQELSRVEKFKFAGIPRCLLQSSVVNPSEGNNSAVGQSTDCLSLEVDIGKCRGKCFFSRWRRQSDSFQLNLARELGKEAFAKRAALEWRPWVRVRQEFSPEKEVHGSGEGEGNCSWSASARLSVVSVEIFSREVAGEKFSPLCAERRCTHR